MCDNGVVLEDLHDNTLLRLRDAVESKMAFRRHVGERPEFGYLKVAGEKPMTVVLLILFRTVAFAQSPAPGGMPPPPGMSLAGSAAMRFPQPVRVGDMLHRHVLKPVESHDNLGRVEKSFVAKAVRWR